jgi:regulator of cell morphogenesis and NO signaling
MSSRTRLKTLAELATQNPAASRVFHRRRIDFCCQGERTLEEVCRESSTDPAELEREIREEAASGAATDVRWDERPTGQLLDFILARYHAPLRGELDRLLEMAEKVERVHGAKDPERLPRLHSLVAELRRDLLEHLAKEESVLFPWIRRGEAKTAGGPISVMLREHDTAGALLREIEVITEGHSPPPGACNTWRALYLGLAELDRDLKDHIHLENHVLFPRALRS